MKNTKALTLSAMLLAIATVLGFIKIPVNQIIELRFMYLAYGIGGYILGPVYGTLIGAFSDILAYVVKPTGGFFPGFTISAALQGFIYGMTLYKHEVSLKRVMIVQVAISIIISLVLNTLWLSMLYKMPFAAALTPRIVKTIVMCPIEALILYLVLKKVPDTKF
ncbi:MAG: folate family ECF transporter S component [Erysipelotrichaceae bacterium]|nr:folate family ECF transporter S component [Erysipelotrichaceae bacterium]